MHAKDAEIPTSDNPVRRLIRRLVYGVLISFAVCIALIVVLLGHYVYSVDTDLLTKAQIRALAARCPQDRQVCAGYTDVALLPDHVVDVFVAATRPVPLKNCRICVLLKPLAPETRMTTGVARILMQFQESRAGGLRWHAQLTLMSLKTESTLSPDSIASLYLNNAYFGIRDLRGIGAASMTHLAKPPGELTLLEAAELAAVERSSSSLRDKEYRLLWRNRTLDQMVADGTLEPEHADTLKDEPLAITE